MIFINTYIVKRGDTLWGISNQYGVSVTELARINNVTANTLKVGQELIIPLKDGTNPSNMFIYTVKKGDSLYSIAKKYNTTVNKIIDINNLNNVNLSIGQELRIPENYTEGDLVLPNFINYTVKKGDNLYSIARNYNITVNDIIKDNNLSSNLLSIGQNLKIRVNESDNVVVEECFGEEYVPSNENNNNQITYIVKKGDNLYSIAKRFNTGVDNIIKNNNLSSSNLYIGQQLII